MKEQTLQSPSTKNLVQRRLSQSPKTFVDNAANKENEIQVFEDESFQEFEAFDDRQRNKRHSLLSGKNKRQSRGARVSFSQTKSVRLYSPESFKSKDVTMEFGRSPDKKLPRKALDELSVQDLAPLPAVTLAEKPVLPTEETESANDLTGNITLETPSLSKFLSQTDNSDVTSEVMQTPSLKKLLGNIEERTPMHLKTPTLNGLLAEVTEHISPGNIKALKTPSVSNLLIDFDEDMSITNTDGLQVVKASELNTEQEQVTTGSHPVVKFSDSLKEFLSSSKISASQQNPSQDNLESEDMNLTGFVPQSYDQESSQNIPIVKSNSPIDNISYNQTYAASDDTDPLIRVLKQKYAVDTGLTEEIPSQSSEDLTTGPIPTLQNLLSETTSQIDNPLNELKRRVSLTKQMFQEENSEPMDIEMEISGPIPVESNKRDSVSIGASPKVNIGGLRTSLGEKRASIGERRASVGERKASIGENRNSIGDSRVSIGERKPSIGENRNSIGEFRMSIGESRSSIGEFQPKGTSQMSFEDFMQRAQLRQFLPVSAEVRLSIARMSSARKLGVEEMLEIACVGTPKLEVYYEDSDKVKSIVNEINDNVRNAENEVNSQNPAVFQEMINSSSERRQFIQEQLGKLKDKCKRHAADTWYEWRVLSESKLGNSLAAKLGQLTTDLENMNILNSRLSELKKQLNDDKEGYLSRRKEGQTTHSIPVDPAPLPISQESISVDQATEEYEVKKDIYSTLSGLQMWKIDSLTLNHLVLHLDGRYSLSLNLGKITNNKKRVIVQKSFVEMGSKTKEFTKALISSAKIDELLQKLTHTGELSDVLSQISLRLGRVSQLEREIKKLERTLTIRRNQSETPEIEIEFSSLKRRSKFFVQFELHAFYPFGELKYKYDNLFGEVSEAEVISAISSVPVPAGFGRLTKICDAIRRLL